MAVRLYLEGVVKQLILYLPYSFDHGSYSDNYLNGLHRNFSSKCNINSLAELQAAIEAGAEVVYGNGYHARNTLIAQHCSALVAFTFCDDVTPKPGGTLDTWNKVPVGVPKLHVPLSVNF